MKNKRNTLHPAPEERQLRAKDKMIILSRKDRMGKAQPTWYRVLAGCLVLIVILVLVSQKRHDAMKNRTVQAEPLIYGTVRLSFTGDLDLGGNVAVLGETEGYENLFAGVSPLWTDSDYVFSCLDGVVLPDDAEGFPAAETAETPRSVSGRAVEAAAAAGINALSLANDHSLDYGSAGLGQSLRTVRELGLQYAGAGENLSDAGMYRVLEANGLRVGFLACSAINPNGHGPIDDYTLSTTSYSDLYRNVLLASDQTDLVVVYICWGDQDSLTVSDAQRRVAHRLVEMGADVVIGTHPHVLQPVEQYQNGWIFYSLGDLVNSRDQRGERESVLLRLDVDAETRSASFTLIPLLLQDFCPAATENVFYVDQIHRSLLRELPETSYSVAENGRIMIPLKLSH